LPALSGCGAAEPATQPQSQVVEPSAVTAAADTLAEFMGKVVKVVDGDTIDVLNDEKKTIRIRFHGIDWPERGQPSGNNATGTLKASVLRNVVKVVSYGQDKYDRTISDIYHDGTLINRALVAVGMAWHYVKYVPDDSALAEAEKRARKLKTGLWSGSHKVVSPWNWRRMSKAERDESR